MSTAKQLDAVLGSYLRLKPESADEQLNAKPALIDRLRAGRPRAGAGVHYLSCACMPPAPARTDEQWNAIPGSTVFIVKQLNTVGLHMPLGARLDRRAIVCGARLG